MSNPQPFRWEQIDHTLVGTRTTAIRKELFALLAKGPSLKEEERIAELADKLYSVYCEVWELQGFRKNAMFIGIVHGKFAHLSSGKDSPEPRSIQPEPMGRVVALPQVGGLHHRYERRAA